MLFSQKSLHLRQTVASVDQSHTFTEILTEESAKGAFAAQLFLFLDAV
jgi:hypothetical protein